MKPQNVGQAASGFEVFRDEHPLGEKRYGKIVTTPYC